jgi:hypothetical protein
LHAPQGFEEGQPKCIEVAPWIDQHLAPRGEDAVSVLGVCRDRTHGGQHLVRERSLHHELMRKRIRDVVDPALAYQGDR